MLTRGLIQVGSWSCTTLGALAASFVMKTDPEDRRVPSGLEAS